jgi:hypothetical protein
MSSFRPTLTVSKLLSQRDQNGLHPCQSKTKEITFKGSCRVFSTAFRAGLLGSGLKFQMDKDQRSSPDLFALLHLHQYRVVLPDRNMPHQDPTLPYILGKFRDRAAVPAPSQR